VGNPRAWAEIDLSALDHNLDRIRSQLAPTSQILLVVKADAYGHGAIPIAARAAERGLDAFGVGTVAEAVELRRCGIRGRVLVLGAIVDDEAEDALEHDVELGVHSADRCHLLAALAGRRGRRARVHLNVDTGMGRLGAAPRRALELLELIAAAPSLELCGVMTHMASPRGGHDPATAEQLQRFDELLRPARERRLLRGWIHAANSAAIFTGLGRQFDAVRPGIAAMGMLPDEDVGPTDLRPVLSLRSQVIFFKDVEAGTPIGYAGTWRAARRSRIATLPVGYNDGVPWRLGNSGRVLLRGQFAPIVGRVSMDYTTVDVTDIPGVEVGSVATLIGRDGNCELRAEELARAVGTIPYEITCSIGRRVPRQVLHPRAPRGALAAARVVDGAVVWS
jgi:alanine racemase